MKTLQSKPSVTLTKADNAAIVLALILIALLTLHLAQDVVYGYEPARVSVLIGVPVAALWLYATIALVGHRTGYLLLLFGSFFAAIVPIIHMSGRGVRAEVVTSSGGLLFIEGLIAIAMSAAIACLLSIDALWRLRQSLLGFVLWCVIPLGVLSALLAYVVQTRN